MSGNVHAIEDLQPLPSAHGTRRVGRYLLCDQIGFGGMATIHVARLIGSQGFSRTVAVKQLHPQFAQNPMFVTMLLDEARLAARVHHVNVVSPLDIVATETELFIVMDYVGGESFANLLAAANGPLCPTLAGAIFVQVLMGLHAAHEATREQGETLGLVHRDVSPQNILIGRDGVARMLDFGIAKAVARAQTTESGVVKGKLGYMAPEQVRLEPVDRRADVFCAGVVLWEALTDTNLFVADTLGASIDLILHRAIAPPSQFNPRVTPGLDAVVLKALARDPNARFQDAMSMAVALERALHLASTLEVIEWIESLAGAELDQKADVVRRAEALSWQSMQAMKPPLAVVATPAHAGGAHRNWSEAGPISSRPVYRTRTLMGLPEPPEDPIADSLTVGNFTAAGMPNGESTSVDVDGDREAVMTIAPTIASKSGHDRKSMGIALGIVLASAAAALGILSLSGREPESSLADAQPLAIEPASSVAVPAPPLEASSAAMTRPLRFELLPIDPLTLPLEEPPKLSGPLGTEPPTARPPDSAARAASGPSSSPRASAGRTVHNARSAASAQKSDFSSAVTSKPLTSKPSDTLPPPSAEACKQPWVLDEQRRVKSIKVECLY